MYYSTHDHQSGAALDSSDPALPGRQIMGMDVSGKEPRSSTGEYFQNTILFWHPLWRLCCEVYPPCAKVQGHSNDGDGLDDAGAVELGRRLQAALASGRATAFMEATRREHQAHFENEDRTLIKQLGKDLARQAGLPRTAEPASVYVSNVREFAAFCLDCGGFEIW
jgi:hypothetical protein